MSEVKANLSLLSRGWVSLFSLMHKKVAARGGGYHLGRE